MRAGTMVGPFRIERLIAEGSTGAVYEARQLSLRRTVALRLIEPGYFRTVERLARFDHQQRLAAAVHHPNLVACYEVGEWDGGRFIAMRLIRGTTLADLHERGSPPAAESLAPLAGAVRAVHDAGLVHGRISDENILVEPDGTPYLADVGLSDHGSPEGDMRALAEVVSRLPVEASLTRNRKAHRALGLGLAALAGIAAVLVLALNGGDDPRASLDPGWLGCREDPSSNTPACTLAQTRLDGRAETVQRAGVIRSWEVRGASGDLALQVIRERQDESFVVGFSQPQRVTDPAPVAFPAEIGVRPGDRIAIRLAPGASIGVQPASSRSAVVRWDGGLTAGPQAADATTPAVELMLRAEVEFGARPDGPRQLLGREAASAPDGRPLAEASVSLSARRAARVALVELPRGIAVDVFRGRRLARIDVADADPDGELLELVQNCGPRGPRGFCLRWRNPGEELALLHEYTVRGSGRIKLIG